VSALVLVAPTFDGIWESSVPSVICLFAFLALLLLLALARVDSFRDETGWHWSLLVRTLGETFQSLADWGSRIVRAPWAQKVTDVAKPLLVSGLLVGASASATSAIGCADDVVTVLRVVGFVLLASGVGAIALGWGWLLKLAKHTGRRLDAAGVPAALHALNELPSVLDCRDARTVRAAAERASHPLVSALLAELVRPWSRPRYNDEREYQDRLLKRLLASMPEANPRSERWIGNGARADILIGTDSGGLLIEMKVHANTSALDRLIGQTRRYLDVWRGPMLLVLCKTGPEVTARLESEVRQMRQQGHAVIAVLAAP
jgi:hypothetical protein